MALIPMGDYLAFVFPIPTTPISSSPMPRNICRRWRMKRTLICSIPSSPAGPDWSAVSGGEGRVGDVSEV